MTNINLMKSKMALHGDTIEMLSDAMRISRMSLSAKINGQREFKQSEIQFIMNQYQLTPQDVVDIFFANKVS